LHGPADACHCHPKTPSALASFKSRLVLPFWYWLTQDVLQKRTLNRCSSRSSKIKLLLYINDDAGLQSLHNSSHIWHSFSPASHWITENKSILPTTTITITRGTTMPDNIYRIKSTPLPLSVNVDTSFFLLSPFTISYKIANTTDDYLLSKLQLQNKKLFHVPQ